jgi:quercetin dioxygenase-like cupin family protein
MPYSIVTPGEEPWITRPHAAGQPARHVAELSDVAGMEHVRANVWRYEPGAAGRRHRQPVQDETFVVLAGTLSIYLGDPPERRDVPAGSLVHVTAGTALQSVNHGDQDLIVYAHGWPPEDRHAELLDSAV